MIFWIWEDILNQNDSLMFLTSNSNLSHEQEPSARMARNEKVWIINDGRESDRQIDREKNRVPETEIIRKEAGIDSNINGHLS